MRARTLRACTLACFLALPACDTDGGTGPPVQVDTVSGPPELTIRYVRRLPELEWVWGSDDPAREGWPAPGQQVTWRAHVRSWARDTMTVGYRWLLDGAEVSTGTLTLPPGETATADFDWSWTFDRHELRFEVDPDDAIEEGSEWNNAVTLATDALSIGLFVEQRFYDFYRVHLDQVSGSWNSFEDWAHGHVAAANRMFESARYPEAPDGVLDRWRLDRVVVVEDGTLTRGARNRTDRTVDLIWGFRAREVDFLRSASGDYSPVFGFRGAFLHELGHARYLIDVYLWNLFDGWRGNEIGILENGEPVLGSELWPGEGPVYLASGDTAYAAYFTPEQGLMNDEYTHIDRYSAIALNLIAGERPRFGNHNCPENCGASKQYLPADNRLTVTDAAGTPLVGATVQVYRSEIRESDGTRSYFDDTPDMTLETDGDGSVLLGSNPFGTFPLWSSHGDTPETRWHVILRVESADGRVGYAVLESRLFNLEYWRGNRELGEHTLPVRMVDP